MKRNNKNFVKNHHCCSLNDAYTHLEHKDGHEDRGGHTEASVLLVDPHHQAGVVQKVFVLPNPATNYSTVFNGCVGSAAHFGGSAPTIIPASAPAMKKSAGWLKK